MSWHPPSQHLAFCLPLYSALRFEVADIFSLSTVRDRVEELLAQWESLRASADQRRESLQHALQAAELFWQDVGKLQADLAELRERILSAEPAAAIPADIEAQTSELARQQNRLNAWQVDLDRCRRGGDDLNKLVDAPERPEVTHTLDEAERMAQELAAKVKARDVRLATQLERARVFQEELVRLLEWIQLEESRLDGLGPVGTDTPSVQAQLVEVKRLKQEVEPKHADIERLNQTGYELTREALTEARAAVDAPLSDLNSRWDNLLDGINERKVRDQRGGVTVKMTVS